MTDKLRGWRRIRKNLRRLQWSVLRRFSDRADVDCAQGRFAVYTADSVIGKQLYTHGGYEREWVDRAVGHLEAAGLLPGGGGTLLDVGANIGVIVVSLLRTGRFAECVAIEPTPRNLDLLHENLRRNGLEQRVRVLPTAAGSVESTMTLELDPTNYGDNRIRARLPAGVPDHCREGERATVEVPLRRIDRQLEEEGVAAGDISLMWIDVQGFEGHAFLGAEKLLARGVPTVSEVWPYAILRSGMSLDDFAAIVNRFWTHVAVPEGGAFRVMPASGMRRFLADLGEKGDSNVIFTRAG